MAIKTETGFASVCKIEGRVTIIQRYRPARLAYPKADDHHRPERLRVVRHLPVRAELSKPGEAWGQVLDKPPGRKPRGRVDEDQQRRGTMGI